jgi:hypothetical protein
MLTALLLAMTLQATEPPEPEVKPPTPPIDTKALARAWARELTGSELHVAAELHRHREGSRRPGTTAGADGIVHAAPQATRTYRIGDRVRVIAVHRDRAGILVRVGPPGHAIETPLPGGNTSSSVRTRPPPHQEAAGTYDLFEKSARYADREARRRRANASRVVTVLVTGRTREEYRAALRRLFAVP